MGKVTSEVNFPRGGTRDSPHKVKCAGNNNQLLQRKRTLMIKQVKQHATQQSLSCNHPRPLSYELCSQDMLLAACVKEVHDTHLSVNLPGRLVAEASIMDFSDSCSVFLNKTAEENSDAPYSLKDLVHVGQYVVAKIKEIIRDNNNHKIKLTLNPNELHSGWSHIKVKEGHVLTCAVKSVEEHGYSMDLGIVGTRAFLEKEQAAAYAKLYNNQDSLVVGQLVPCTVLKKNLSGHFTTVVLSVEIENIGQYPVDLDGITVQTILPGLRFKAEVTEVYPNGVKVKFNKTMVGFVSKDHFYDENHIPFIGEICIAYVLYITPKEKVIYLSLLKCLCEPETISYPVQVLKQGTLIDHAEVLQFSRNGIYLMLQHDGYHRGFVPFKRLPLEGKPNEKVCISNVKQMYPLNSKQQCVILAYNYLEHIYFCTMEKAAVDGNLMSPGTLSLGMKVKGRPSALNLKEAVVLLGNDKNPVRAFVPFIHLSDQEISNQAQWFFSKQTIITRVLDIREGRIRLTMKDSLLNSKLTPLVNFDDAIIGNAYDGVVVKIDDNGALISFYGNVKGYLSSENYGNISLKIGNVVKCYVTEKSSLKNFLQLRLEHPGNEVSSDNKLDTGELYNLTVTEIADNKLIVALEDFNIAGEIYAVNLTDVSCLRKALLSTYKVGDIIRNAYCINAKKRIFSIQKTVMNLYKSDAVKYLDSHSLYSISKKIVIPCYVNRILKNDVEVCFPVPNLRERFKISIEDFPVDKHSVTKYEVFQAALQNGKIPKGGAPLKKKNISIIKIGTFSTTADATERLSDYLDSYHKIQSDMFAKEHPLTKFQVGSIVHGIVRSISDTRAILDLPYNIQGLVKECHFGSVLIKCGSSLKGIVTFVDYADSFIELSLREDLMKIDTKISAPQPLVLSEKEGVRGLVVDIRPELILVALQDSRSGLFTYMPPIQVPSFQCSIGQIFDMEIERVESHYSIVLIKELKNFLDNRHLRNKAVRKLKKKSATILTDSNVETLLKGKRRRITCAVFSEDCDSPVKSVKGNANSIFSESKGDCSSNVSQMEFGDTSIDSTEAAVEDETMSGNSLIEEKCRLNGSDSTELAWHVTKIKPLAVPFSWEDKSDLSYSEGCSEKNVLETYSVEELSSKMPSKRLNSTNKNIEKLEEKLNTAVDDYEQEICHAPENLHNWLKYIAFYMLINDFKSAEEIVTRAAQAVSSNIVSCNEYVSYIKSLSFKNIREKQYMWLALLCIAIIADKVSFHDLLSEFMECSNDKHVCDLLTIISQRVRPQLYSNVLNCIRKKYPHSLTVWNHIIKLYMESNQKDKARIWFKHGLDSLNKKYHLSFISQMAAHEMSFGSINRGQVLMEKLLEAYPSRHNIWSMYAEMLLKSKRIDCAREIYDRALKQNITINQLKEIFTKYINFESKLGNLEQNEKFQEISERVNKAVTKKLRCK